MKSRHDKSRPRAQTGWVRLGSARPSREALTFVLIALLLADPAVLRAQKPALHPPVPVLESLAQLREIDSLQGLPASIRLGTFLLPDGTVAKGWMLAAPGAAWNATDAIVDPSLPGRRMIVAACDSAICILHYERGGIAHLFFVAAFAHGAGGWKMSWMASGHPAAANLNALKALLLNRSPLDYHDDTQASSLYR